MLDEKKTVFSRRIPAGERRTYFIDVREAEENQRAFLILGESRLADGVWKSSRLLLSGDQAHAWKDTLEEALLHL